MLGSLGAMLKFVGAFDREKDVRDDVVKQRDAEKKEGGGGLVLCGQPVTPNRPACLGLRY